MQRFTQDVSRTLGLLFLKRCATHLPAEQADKIAVFLSWLIPFNTAKPANVAKVFGVDSVKALEIVKGHRRRHYTDYALGRRMILGKSRLEDYPHREQNAEIVRELRESGASYIIAMGHFTRLATFPLFLPSTTPHALTALTAAEPPRSWRPGILWRRMQVEHYFQLLRQIRPDLHLSHPGSVGALKGMIRKLRSSGNAVIISVDAHWPHTENGHVRPFAGHPSRCFSHGAAWIARMAQCPIVLCLPYLDETGNPVLDWRLKLAPPAKDDEAADMRITNQLIDEVEAAVFRHPEQYVLDFTA